jgi:hypothetical protein
MVKYDKFETLGSRIGSELLRDADPIRGEAKLL